MQLNLSVQIVHNIPPSLYVSGIHPEVTSFIPDAGDWSLFLSRSDLPKAGCFIDRLEGSALVSVIFSFVFLFTISLIFTLISITAFVSLWDFFALLFLVS